MYCVSHRSILPPPSERLGRVDGRGHSGLGTKSTPITLPALSLDPNSPRARGIALSQVNDQLK